MAAVIELGEFWTTGNNATGPKQVTATPAVGDLIVLVCVQSGSTTATAPTDNNADGLGTYTLLESATRSSTDIVHAWVRDALIGSATSTIFTNNNATNTGGGLCALKITGMTKVGSAAKRQSAKQDNQGASTPAPAFSVAALTTNPVIGAVVNAASPAALTSPAAGSFSEWVDTGYSTPTTGIHVTASDSGFTGTTVTWGSPSSIGFGSLVVELDASSSSQSNAPRARILQMLRNA
jgi:hypothetical protein